VVEVVVEFEVDDVVDVGVEDGDEVEVVVEVGIEVVDGIDVGVEDGDEVEVEVVVEVVVGVGGVVGVEVEVEVEVEEIAMSDAMLAHLLNELQKKVAKLEIRIFELEKVQVKTDAALYRARRTLALLLATEKGVKRVQGKEGPVGDGAGEGG